MFTYNSQGEINGSCLMNSMRLQMSAAALLFVLKLNEHFKFQMCTFFLQHRAAQRNTLQLGTQCCLNNWNKIKAYLQQLDSL